MRRVWSVFFPVALYEEHVFYMFIILPHLFPVLQFVKPLIFNISQCRKYKMSQLSFTVTAIPGPQVQTRKKHKYYSLFAPVTDMRHKALRYRHHLGSKACVWQPCLCKHCSADVFMHISLFVIKGFNVNVWGIKAVFIFCVYLQASY